MVLTCTVSGVNNIARDGKASGYTQYDMRRWKKHSFQEQFPRQVDLYITNIANEVHE